MIWHDGLPLIWHCMVVGSSLGELKLNFIFFCYGRFGWNGKG